MTLVPGFLQVDIFVTNIPIDPKPMPPAGTDPRHQKSTPRPGPKLQRHSWTPGKHPATLHAPQMSQPSTSMEDVPLGTEHPAPIHLVLLEEKGRRHMSQASPSDDYNTLLVHSPHPEPSGGAYGDGGLKGDSYDYEMGVGAGGHYQEDSTYDVLDYTHFNGDLDAEVAPAEDLLSRRLRMEGATRRGKTRKLAMGYQNDSWVDLGQLVESPTSAEFSPLSSLHGHGTEQGDDYSPLGSVEPALTRKQARRVSVPAYLQQYEFAQRDPSKPRVRADRASISSIRESVSDVSAVQSMMPKTGKGARGEEMEIQFSGEELEDVLAMAEYAWPGRPMLDKLLQGEVDMAKGPIVVACE